MCIGLILAGGVDENEAREEHSFRPLHGITAATDTAVPTN